MKSTAFAVGLAIGYKKMLIHACCPKKLEMSFTEM